MLDYELYAPIIRSVPKPRRNFKRVDWGSYAKKLDHTVKQISSTSGCYECFVETMKFTASKYMSREFRKIYIPTWNKTYSSLDDKFQETNNYWVADNLVKSLNINRRNRWYDTTEQLNFTHSSRKTQRLMKKLGAEVFYCRRQMGNIERRCNQVYKCILVKFR